MFQRAASEGGTLGGQRAAVIAEEGATLWALQRWRMALNGR